jgi:hypothetical protein
VTAEALARRFHETYERLAPDHGYETRKASAVPWEDVPEQNRSLMIAVAGEILRGGDHVLVELPRGTARGIVGRLGMYRTGGGTLAETDSDLEYLVEEIEEALRGEA